MDGIPFCCQPEGAPLGRPVLKTGIQCPFWGFDTSTLRSRAGRLSGRAPGASKSLTRHCGLSLTRPHVIVPGVSCSLHITGVTVGRTRWAAGVICRSQDMSPLRNQPRIHHVWVAQLVERWSPKATGCRFKSCPIRGCAGQALGGTDRSPRSRPGAVAAVRKDLPIRA